MYMNTCFGDEKNVVKGDPRNPQIIMSPYDSKVLKGLNDK